jgi:hypothetical protein
MPSLFAPLNITLTGHFQKIWLKKRWQRHNRTILVAHKWVVWVDKHDKLATDKMI